MLLERIKWKVVAFQVVLLHFKKMCGIFCMLSKLPDPDSNSYVDHFRENISRRGPDSVGEINYSGSCCNLSFLASVLWTQGENVTKQPLESNKSIFVFNGDIFGGVSDEVKIKTGDTRLLMELIENSKQISVELARIRGPYAFIFLDKLEEKLYFGRDCFGRVSLLIGKNGDSVVVTSVAKRTKCFDFVEVPSIGTFCWSLRTDELSVLPFVRVNPNFSMKLKAIGSFLAKNISVNQDFEFSDHTKEFVGPATYNLAIFDQLKGIESHEAFQLLLSDAVWINKVLSLKRLLMKSLDKRISTQPKFCKNCLSNNLPCSHSLIGILFSGGIDCAILALLADKFVDKSRPIDLINVSFDETRGYLSPDRKTGLQSLEELGVICPDRQWKFVEINVSKNELDDERNSHIADLIYPLNTVLDDSLGCALWFASKGSGKLYSSPCRVLLVGMGADELFGGYTKHRAAFKNHSWIGLHDAMNNDWQNLSHRNLGRDNRVICDHGRQLRIPYLDEDVVDFVRNLQCWEKSYPSADIPPGFGEKLLLRALAYHLGLKQAALIKKRALQFGSRIANKKENAHEVSHRLCFQD